MHDVMCDVISLCAGGCILGEIA